MNKSLAAFMVMAAIVIIMVTLFFGISYTSLASKNTNQEKVLQTVHQLQTNP